VRRVVAGEPEGAADGTHLVVVPINNLLEDNTFSCGAHLYRTRFPTLFLLLCSYSILTPVVYTSRHFLLTRE
jgi:hypothetical protein